MPLELGVWRIDQGVKPVRFGPLDLESRLKDILDQNIEIASPDWMVIGPLLDCGVGPRQVQTDQEDSLLTGP